MANNQQGQFDWQQFERIFGQSFPYFQSGQLQNMMKDPSWVQTYVQDVLKKALPGGGMFPTGGPTNTSSTSSAPMSGAAVPGLQQELFETHQSVIVRFTVDSSIDPYSLKLRLEPMKLTLAGLPDGRTANVKLPVPVKLQNARAQYQDQVLEVRLPKETYGNNGKPLAIQFPNG